jgi:D-3-phosphoglycerate dehydrogenase
MNVLGYDPAISVDAAWRLPSDVQKMENLPTLFARSDYVTLHVPLLDDTRNMINDETLKAFRPGTVLLNFARQEIVDEAALSRALESGRLDTLLLRLPVAGAGTTAQRFRNAASRREYGGGGRKTAP